MQESPPLLNGEESKGHKAVALPDEKEKRQTSAFLANVEEQKSVKPKQAPNTELLMTPQQSAGKTTS